MKNITIYKCPVCGIELVQSYGHRIPGTNHRIKHYDSVAHAMLYTSETDADYQSYNNCSSSLRPYKDGKVFREVHSVTGEAIGREWVDIQ